MTILKRRGKTCNPLYFFVALILFFTSCQDKMVEPDVSAAGYDYFPVEQGRYRVYEVSETEYSILGEPSLRAYYLKEAVEDSFLNLENEHSWLLRRYVRSSVSEAWSLDSVWTVSKNRSRVAVVENNIPYVKLVFPVAENKVWDGNALNAQESELYTMKAVGGSAQVGDSLYNNTVTVIQMDNQDTLLFRDKRVEIYSRNIGLLYKESVKLNYCSDIECIGEGVVESGRIITQELIDYGKE